MMKRSVCLLLLGIVLMGCATAPQKKVVDLRTPYQSGVFELNGSAKLTVNSFLRTRGGDIKLCSGYEVNLWKVTPYSSERFIYLYDKLGDVYVSSLDSGITEFRSEMPFTVAKTCDSQGNVVFDGVPVGLYYLSSMVIWETVNTSGGLGGQGGRTAIKVEITDATTDLDIVLTR